MPWVLLIDADLQFDFGELAAFLPLAPSSDLIVGRRLRPQDSAGRRMRAALWSRALRRAFDLPVRDVDCAFRLIRRELLGGLVLRAGGPLVGAEILIKAQAVGARIAEVPVHHRVRVAGRRPGAGPRRSGRTLRELADLRRALNEVPAHA
jgi:hypothetical protein